MIAAAKPLAIVKPANEAAVTRANQSLAQREAAQREVETAVSFFALPCTTEQIATRAGYCVATTRVRLHELEAAGRVVRAPCLRGVTWVSGYALPGTPASRAQRPPSKEAAPRSPSENARAARAAKRAQLVASAEVVVLDALRTKGAQCIARLRRTLAVGDWFLRAAIQRLMERGAVVRHPRWAFGTPHVMYALNANKGAS